MLESFENLHTRTDYEKSWPDSFDFETDETCQTLFKPFIEEQLEKLKAFDAQRPSDITYIFHEHSRRVADDIKNTCLYMRLSDKVANNLYWAILPHDIGKKELPLNIWDVKSKPDGKLKALRRTHTILGALLTEEYFKDLHHPFKTLMVEIMLHHHEQMDGDTALSLPVRLAAIIDAFDGWRIFRPHYGKRDISVPGVLNRMRVEKGGTFFDMELFETFAEVKLPPQKKT